MKKVVSATLAGALAVGMVPAMALADDAIELQADIADDVALGAITAADDEDGKRLNLNGELKFTLSDKTTDPLYVVPTEVTTFSGASFDVAAKGGIVKYYKVVKKSAGTDDFSWIEDGDYVAAGFAGSDANFKTNGAGEYYAVVYANAAAETAGQGVAVKFTIEADTLDGAYLYEFNNTAADKGVSDVEFNYTAGNVLSNLKLTFGEYDDIEVGDYSLSFFQKGVDGKYAALTTLPSVTPAGDYAVVIDGAHEYEGYLSDPIYFSVGKLDLSKANIVLKPAKAYDDFNAGEMADDVLKAELLDSVNGITESGLLDQLDILFDGNFPGTTELEAGKYTYTLFAPQVDSATPGVKVDNPNITGTATLTVVRYETPAVIEYDGDTDFDLTVPATPVVKFDPAEITVTDGDPVAPAKVPYTVTYVKQDKNDASKWDEVSSFSAPGTYKAIVEVDDATFEFGGKQEIKFAVAATPLTDSNVFITYGGKLQSSDLTGDSAVNYTGANVLDDIDITVVDKDGKALTEGVDYVVFVANALKPTVAVDEVVNVGTYMLTVMPAEGSKYSVSTSLNIQVKAAGVKAKLFSQVDDGDSNENTVKVLYTGSEIDPIIGFQAKFDINKDLAVNAKDVIDVPEAAYSIDITYYKDKAGKEATALTMPEAIQAAGTYKFEIVPAVDNVNFAFESVEYTVVVTDQNVFVDVPSDAWYADEVYEVAAAGIMGGYASSKFGPNDNAERQDLAVMILRMLEPSTNLNNIKEILGINGKDYSKLISMVTGLTGELDLPFTDAKGNAYYSAAVWYCNENGIMTGYANSDEFGVGDAVTREQVAATLYRIDQAGFFGNGLPMFASNLDAYADADEVSKYAVEAMEWAVENGIMGVNTAYLNPGEEITRAELAAMFVRFADYNAGKLQA